MHFSASNNAAEYEALLHGLWIATALGVHRLKVLGDSMLIINQANKEWSCLDDKMLLYYQELHKLENNFNDLEYLHILREKNEITDELAKLGSNRAAVPTGIFLQELHEPTISKALAKANKAVESSQEALPLNGSITESLKVMKIHSDWHTPFMVYLRTGGLLEDKVKCERLHQQVGQYTLANDELYRRGTNDTLMKCVTPEEERVMW
jgi:ribonuclease HI